MGQLEPGGTGAPLGPKLALSLAAVAVVEEEENVSFDYYVVWVNIQTNSFVIVLLCEF